MALRSEEETAVESRNKPVLADRKDVTGIADLRKIPLARLCGDGDAQDLVRLVMARAEGASLDIVVAGFQSAVS
jgi:hypothetical protein